MLKAKLVKPNRLMKDGVLWERGKEVPVNIATARLLMKDPRFEIIGLDELLDRASANEAALDKLVDEDKGEQSEAPEETSSTNRPANTKELYAAIREAADQLDPDDEDSFTATGKPQVAALEKILGYDITASERDAALAEAVRRGSFDEGEGQAAKRGGVVIRRVSKSKEETSEAKAEGNDPSTQGAVEV